MEIMVRIISRRSVQSLGACTEEPTLHCQLVNTWNRTTSHVHGSWVHFGEYNGFIPEDSFINRHQRGTVHGSDLQCATNHRQWRVVLSYWYMQNGVEAAR